MEYDVTGIKLQYMDVRRLPHYTREVERVCVMQAIIDVQESIAHGSSSSSSSHPDLSPLPRKRADPILCSLTLEASRSVHVCDLGILFFKI